MIAQRETKPQGPTLQDFYVFDLAPDGYRRCLPDPIDTELATTARCECGHVGLEAHGYRRPGSYRCFWNCQACGQTQEA